MTARPYDTVALPKDTATMDAVQGWILLMDAHDRSIIPESSVTSLLCDEKWKICYQASSVQVVNKKHKTAPLALNTGKAKPSTPCDQKTRTRSFPPYDRVCASFACL